MTNEQSRKALDRLVDALVDDILNTPDADVLMEFRETAGNPDKHAADMLALFESTLLKSNKRRLDTARAGVAASRRIVAVRHPTVAIANARAFLRSLLEKPAAMERLTLAARKESELSDTDILGLLNDLRELGMNLPDEDPNGNQ